MKTSIIVVGAGLAGSCAAHSLSTSFDVTVIANEPSPADASTIGAGLANPILGRRARRVWRAEEAIEALQDLIDATDADYAVERRPIVRPAQDAFHVRKFKAAAAESPNLARWLEPGDCGEEYPFIDAAIGALQMTGLAVDIGVFSGRVLEAARSRDVSIIRNAALLSWSCIEGNRICASVRFGGEDRRLVADHLLLCVGANIVSHRVARALNLHLIKGQTVITELPELPDGWPHLSGNGYVAVQSDHLVLGSTYEHEFDSPHPTAAGTADILQRVSALSPLLEQLTVREARAGVRVSVPRSYLPMFGPLPGQQNVWVFSGLGSKGLLMAPMIARDVPNYICGDLPIPVEIRPH